MVKYELDYTKSAVWKRRKMKKKKTSSSNHKTNNIKLNTSENSSLKPKKLRRSVPVIDMIERFETLSDNNKKSNYSKKLNTFYKNNYNYYDKAYSITPDTPNTPNKFIFDI